MEASNVKAMRDALLNIQEYAAAMDVDDGNVLAILDACRDALSAPARNCDMYLTQPEMSMAYEAYRNAAMKRYGNGLTGKVPTVKHKPMTHDEWLIAPASERKGEGDA